MFSVHQQTIRLYEKEGLINPKRSEGNTRIFSEEDVDRLEEIIYLTHEVGINLAGVDMILKLQKKIKDLQEQVNTIFNNSQRELASETEQLKQTIQQHAQRLTSLKIATSEVPLPLANHEATIKKTVTPRLLWNNPGEVQAAPQPPRRTPRSESRRVSKHRGEDTAC